jgi:hypothetical protein
MANTLDVNLPTVQSLAEILPLVDTTHTLADDVLRILQDPSYSYDDVLSLFNDCLMDLAGEFLLPDLDTWEDIETDPNTDHVRLPVNFMKNLRYAHSTTYNRKIKRYGGLSQLYRLFSTLDQTGRVLGVCAQGRDLYYQRVPSSAETIRINYYRFPDRLNTRFDKPTCLPMHLVKPLLVNYALKELYNEIEDGIEGQKINTVKHETEYDKHRVKLLMFVGPEQREPVEIADEIEWEAYL